MNLSFKIEKRIEVSTRLKILILFLSLLTGLILCSLIFLINGINPVAALLKIFIGSFGSLYGLKETITKSIPLILTGIGLVLAFKGKFWNIGSEGQILFGAIASTWVALTFGNSLPSFMIIPLMFFVGFLGGALWGFIPALMKIKFGINEIISTLMLNYIAAECVQYLVYGPWKGQYQWGFPYTDTLPESAILAVIPGSRIHYITLIIAIIIVILIFFIINKTTFGYEIKVIGENSEAGRYAGINFFKTISIIMILSGGLAGLAGVGEVAGIHHHLTYPWVISAGYGFTAIIVAWLADLNPLYVILTSFFFAGILVGGDAIQTSIGLPFASVNIFNGLILFCIIASKFFLENRIQVRRSLKKM
jgi:simple sugar transport system permease protein